MRCLGRVVLAFFVVMCAAAALFVYGCDRAVEALM
jgi:hypothetical protein